MKTFEDIKAQWKNQSEHSAPINGPQQIINKTNTLRNKQKITYIILGITTLILIAFFFYVEAYLEKKATFALGLMICGLLIRIIIELWSVKVLSQLKFDVDVTKFKIKLSKYYKSRLKTHYILTPMVLAAYIIGFILLLPYFKQSLSFGFYKYIIISGGLIFAIGILLIFRQIKIELVKIRELLK